MKLLVGRLVLGCFLAVLVRADEPVVEIVEGVKSAPGVAVTIASDQVAEAAEIAKKTKIFAQTNSGDGDIIILPGVASGNNVHHENNDNDHHHAPPAPPAPPSSHHHHPPPPPHYHHPQPYPAYYPPPYYPQPYPYGAQMYAPVPQPYPYYPPTNYYPAQMKPVTVIHTSPSLGSIITSGGGTTTTQNTAKPDLLQQSTGYLWNLIDQKNTELMNLFGSKPSINKDDAAIHEIVVINTNAGSLGTNVGTTLPIATTLPVGTNIPIGTTTQLVKPTHWFNKGKNLATGCNEEK